MKRKVFAMVLMAGTVLSYSCHSATEKAENKDSEEVVQVDSLNQTGIDEEVEY